MIKKENNIKIFYKNKIFQYYMNKSSLISVSLATLLLLFGIFLGFSNFEIDLKILHTTIGFSFILIVIFGLKIHYYRLINKSPTNLIAWIHFFIFSFLLFISIRGLRRWYFVKEKYHKNHKH